MIQPVQSSREALEQLFSIVLVLGEDLRIESASQAAMTRMPWLKDKPRLIDAFDITRPRGITGHQDLLKHSNKLFLMTATDGSFALRGQVVSIESDHGPLVVFCGAPWLFWLNSERPDLELVIRDFSPQDSQLDQLFFMTTEKTMVEDLESLNKELKDAKDDLEIAQRTREAFFAQMSHEMRTPLNGVISALTLLEQHKLSQESRQLVSLIRSSSHNLMQVINYILDVSKIDADDVEADHKPFRLDMVIGSVLDIVGARAMEKELGLHLRIKPGLPANFVGDSARLRQSLLNLVTNAIKFTQKGEVTINVMDITDRPGWLRIDVKDTGVGVPEDLQDQIFEPFFSRPADDGGNGEPGTGLGLDIVRRNIQHMGGELKLKTAEHRGSTFSLLLPLETAAEPIDAMPSAPETEGASNEFRGTVLLVDDNETNLMLGTMLLERLGLNVSGAKSGEQAVEMVSKQCFCLVLMDINMPGIDGFEATRRIRAIPGRGNLPVLALTAYASSREQTNAKLAGMNEYLTKPVSPPQLSEALRRWLPQPAPDQPVHANNKQAAGFNDAVLEELLGQIGRENLAKVIEKFQQEARKRWSALQAATSAGGQKCEAHSLVSTCGSFGLEACAKALAAIEARARGGKMESAAALNRLGEQLKSSLNELDTWIQGAQQDACE